MDILEVLFGSLPIAVAGVLAIALIAVCVLFIVAPVATMFYARKINQRMASIQANLASLTRTIESK